MALRTFECLQCKNLQTDVLPLVDKELRSRSSERPHRDVPVEGESL